MLAPMNLKLVALASVATLAIGGGAVIYDANLPDPGPAFTVSMLNLTSGDRLMEWQAATVDMHLQNTGAPKTFLRSLAGQAGSVRESGTHRYCAILDGAEVSCQNVSLDPDEETHIGFASPELDAGTHEFGAAGEQFAITVIPYPRVGEWSLASPRVRVLGNASVPHCHNDVGNYDVDSEYCSENPNACAYNDTAAAPTYPDGRQCMGNRYSWKNGTGTQLEVNVDDLAAGEVVSLDGQNLSASAPRVTFEGWFPHPTPGERHPLLTIDKYQWKFQS